MLWTFSVHTAIYIKKGSVINVVCYERVCYERVCCEHGLLWKWSVFNRSVMNGSVVNVVCFEWSVMNGLLWTSLFWMGTVLDLPLHLLLCCCKWVVPLLLNHVSSVNCMTHISHIVYNMDFHCYWNVQDEIDPILNFYWNVQDEIDPILNFFIPYWTEHTILTDCNWLTANFTEFWLTDWHIRQLLECWSLAWCEKHPGFTLLRPRQRPGFNQ